MRDEHQARIGAQIASLREQQGWSQRALARWVGIDQSAVSRIEAGRKRLSADELQRIADALQVSADLLLKGRPAASSAAREPTRKNLSQAPTFPFQARVQAGGANEEDLASRKEMSAEPWPSLAFTDAEADSSGTLAPDVGSRLGSSPERPERLAPSDRLVRHQSRSTPDELARVESPPSFSLSPVLGLPEEVASVAEAWFRLRGLAQAPEPAQSWSTGHSAEGKPEHIDRTTAPAHPAATPRDVLFDRVARFWRSELHVDADDGPLPDLVPLIEDGYGAQVIVARVGQADQPASEQPVAASFAVAGTPFIFVNAARPVVLQRFALAHAFAHRVLGHSDVVDYRIQWSRNVPPEAAANDFAEEFLAPVRAVQRWFERRGMLKEVRLEDLLDIGNAFGISAWAALYRSRAAGRLQGKQFHVLRSELQRHEWDILPRQAYLGGLRDTLAFLTPREVLPSGEYGGPAVLRVPAPMRSWALAALGGGRLSLEEAAALLHIPATEFGGQLERLGLE